MKNMKKLLLLILALALVLCLFACGKKSCKEHVDSDEDGKCDKCGESTVETAEPVLLFENGMPLFQIVIESGLSKEIRTIIDDFADMLEDDYDIEIDVVADSASTVSECEILIGDVESRGDEYKYDKHLLGKDGYIFKIIDSKIIINAGSYESLEVAVEEFFENVLVYTEDETKIYMTAEQEVLEIQDDYAITSVKINDVDIKGYTIAADLTTVNIRNAAENLQEMLYDRTGYWLEIVSPDAAANSIVFTKIDKVYGDNSFKISANDKNQLVIAYAFENKVANATASFITSKITMAKGDINFTGEIYKQDISYLTYEEFGAKGDGKTDDFVALYNTHVEANKYGQSVKANDNATYYIHNTVQKKNNTNFISPIPIQTNTDWGKAKFTIDDRDISIMPGAETRAQSQQHIFKVVSDYGEYKITDKAILDDVLEGGLRPGTTKLNLSFDYPVMIIPTNTTHNVYRRKGYGGAQGSAMHEVIVLDKNGNVDPDTPIMFDYTTLDYITVYRLDIDPITINGGIFTTRSSRVNTIFKNENGQTDVEGAYIARGINCNRSFTTFQNVVHYVTDDVTFDEQIDNGKIVHVTACYTAFYYSSNATEVTYKDCIMTGRRCYQRPSDSLSTGTGGTYDLNGSCVNKLYFIGCEQVNFWVTVDKDTVVHNAQRSTSSLPSMSSYTHEGLTVKMHWGIGGTNFCKNMEYIDSTLSRFDAHSGLYNGKVINSTVNYLALTGNGEFIVEDTEWYSEGTGSNGASIFHLRADYGSTWEGNITVKNLDAYVHTGGDSYLFLHTYNNWYYGYIAHMPNLSLDNLDIYDISTFNAVSAGYQVKMMQSSVITEPRMHLNDATTVAQYCYIDLDGDGYVDDTDGAVEYIYENRNNYPNGVTLDQSHPGYTKNLNIIAPPDYLKIINNDGVNGAGGYEFIVPNTYGTAPWGESDEILPEGVDPDGGFFARTKFIYGTGANDFYLGTNHTGTQTFKFD